MIKQGNGANNIQASQIIDWKTSAWRIKSGKAAKNEQNKRENYGKKNSF